MDVRKYIYSHCIEPQKVSIFDSYTQTYQMREVPCGKCLHCRNNHINEWVTRLYAQSKYSKYVYYITLDYAPFDLRNSSARKLAAETAAVYQNLNINKKYGMQPLLLVKNHLQDFFKRFRKNTHKKIQYFACGEYGTHASGKGYGRPHFHIIVFSNESISPFEFESAWSVNGYKIGRVDFHDLVANGSFDDIKTFNNNNYNSNYVFKYVCKYLQKGSFDFEGLATIDFHRTYFKSLQQVLTKSETLFPEFVPIQDPKVLAQNWCDYVRDYSPFVCCSKRPAIGLQYFKENVERFRKQDFKLFGLPEECVTFPLYYVRKTRESFCPFMAVGQESSQPSSNSRVGSLLRSLFDIYEDRTSIEVLFNASANEWNASQKKRILLGFRNVLHLYDSNERIFYQFNGFSYTLWSKVRGIGYVRLYDMDVIDVYNKVLPYWQDYYHNFLTPMRDSRILCESDLQSSISAVFPDKEKFYETVYSIYNNELAVQYKTKLLTQNSKLTL